MTKVETNVGFAYNEENFEAVLAQIDDKRHKELLETTFTMVQQNKEGNNEVSDDNIRRWAERIFK